MIPLRWTERERPLAAVACFVFKAHGAALQARLQGLAENRRGALRLLENRDGYLLLGPEAVLPWLPLAVWLGSDAGAAQLLLPTLYGPDLPLDWVESACIKRAGGACALIPRLALAPALREGAPELLLVASAGSRSLPAVPAVLPAPATARSSQTGRAA